MIASPGGATLAQRPLIGLVPVQAQKRKKLFFEITLLVVFCLFVDVVVDLVQR